MSRLGTAGARGALITLTAQVATVLIKTASLVILARIIAPDIFGLVAIVLAFSTFVSALIMLGIPLATVQATHLSQRAKSSLFYITAFLGIVLGGLLFAFAEPIAELYGRPDLVPIIHWLSLVPIIRGLQAQSRMHLVRQLKYTALSVSDVSSRIIGFIAAVALALSGRPYAAVVSEVLIETTAQFIMVTAAARWIPGLPGKWRTEVRELLLVGLRIFSINFLTRISRSVLVSVLGLSASAVAVGNFDRAQQLSIAPITLTVDQLQRVAVPILSRLREQPERMLAYMRRAQLFGAYFTATAFLVVAALAQPLIEIVLGPAWALAGNVLQVLALGAVFRALGQAMQWVFIGAGQTGKGLRFNAWAQPTIIGISLLGLPWGAMGVAIANTIGWILYWPIAVTVASRAARFSSHYLIFDAIRIIGAFGLPVGLSALSARLLDVSDGGQIILGAAFALVMGGGLALFVRPIRHDFGLLWHVLLLARGPAT